MSKPAGPSGFVRVLERAGGPVFYAQIRTADGKRLQRALGRAWTKRSRPPAGYITRAQAELQLAEILAGRDPEVAGRAAARRRRQLRPGLRRVDALRRVRSQAAAVDDPRLPARDREAADPGVRRGHAALGDHARPRSRPSASGWSPRACSAPGRSTSASSSSTRSSSAPSASTSSRSTRSPAPSASRQRRSGDFTALEPHEVELLAEHAVTDQDAVLFTVAAFTGLRLGELRGLRWGDIDWMRRVVFVRRSYTVDADGPTKSGKVRSVPLVDQAARALDELSRRERWTVGRGPRVRQRRRRAHRGLGAAPALLPRARGAPACRRSASTTCATPSGRSPCRRSRSPT